ncbi:hypothetical protein GCM10028791_38060 [Echinicola sediminis]
MSIKVKIAAYFFGWLTLCICGNDAFAQLQQLSVDRNSANVNNTALSSARLLADTLTLPFWDDFSNAQLDAAKWTNEGAHITYGVGVNSPTIGALLLDGTRSNGQPYSTDIRQQGLGDQVTSQMIDLTEVPSEEQGSIYLSFFWQAGGNAELPDEGDQLELLFLDSLGNWNQVWNQFGGISSNPFQQEILPVSGSYLHDHFQFKFQNSGRLAGPFDSWLIDYVYLHSGRSLTDLNYPDRALTRLNSNFFGKYSAVPLYAFNAQPDTFLTAISNQFNNLNDRFRAMEFTVELRNKADQQLLASLNSNSPFNPVPLAKERRNFSSNLPDEWTNGEIEDTTDFESIIYLSSGDNFLIDQITDTDTTYHQAVDFRVNDTVRTLIPLRDYFAYDRGTVDYAAGINQRSGMLAVKYETASTAYINGISINFTNASQRGTAVDLMVWSSLDQAPIFNKEVVIQEKSSLEEFNYFPLDTAIQVGPIFYIGFTQFTNEFIHIGLDKSNDTSEEVFYNTSGEWQPNTEVIGSLMIRPHLQTSGPDPVNPGASNLIKVYPNPSTENRVYLEGETDLVKMYDLFGREININIVPAEKGKIITFTRSKKGVYLMKVWRGNTSHLIRILAE